MQVNVHQAKSQLSQLLVAVENGEEIVIARNGSPVARLVPAKKRGGMILGILEKEGKGYSTPDDATLAKIDREIEATFYERGEISLAPLTHVLQEPRATYSASAGKTRASKSGKKPR
jgi:prevent-host-death family protein